MMFEIGMARIAPKFQKSRTVKKSVQELPPLKILRKTRILKRDRSKNVFIYAPPQKYPALDNGSPEKTRFFTDRPHEKTRFLAEKIVIFSAFPNKNCRFYIVSPEKLPSSRRFSWKNHHLYSFWAKIAFPQKKSLLPWRFLKKNCRLPVFPR